VLYISGVLLVRSGKKGLAYGIRSGPGGRVMGEHDVKWSIS
jgi:hypothetical protein